MRLHLAFVLLVLAVLIVSAWAIWQDSAPEWRGYQRELVRREIARLEAELAAARAGAERPEIRHELARLDRALADAAADTSPRALALARLGARLDAARARADAQREALRGAERRLREAAADRARRDLEQALERAQQAYAGATGAWPPDTARLRRLWAGRDSLADALLALLGPVQLLRDSLEAGEEEARLLEIEVRGLASDRDSLEAARARLLEPVAARVAALQRLRRHRPRVREIVSPDGREVARCPTCHGTMDDPPGVHPRLPAMEAFRDVPCTACHRGRGRALTVAAAHRGLLTAAGAGAGPHSLRARIERLRSPVAAERERAREELRRLTGVDPVDDGAAAPGDAGPDAATAASWAAWWKTAEPFFEPGDPAAGVRGDPGLAGAGVDPWRFSTRGRPLRYVGSQKCLACHEVLHREHSRQWLATKFRTIERLVEEADPAPCLPCHATGYDPATGRYAEPGVTCEGCHGPGERYNEMMVAGQELIGRGEEARGRALLDHASRLAREAASRRLVPGDTGEMNVCVTCHHPWRHRERGPGVLEREPPAKPRRAPAGPGEPVRG